jgi:acyl carrier protein
MVEQDIRARVRSIILELAPNPGGAKAETTRLVEDLEYHSLSLLELSFTLEDEFDLPPVDHEQVQYVTTVEEVEDLVLRLL